MAKTNTAPAPKPADAPTPAPAPAPANETQAPTAPQADAKVSTIRTDVAMPAVKRGRATGSEKYPFSQLPAPVPVVDSNGNPVVSDTGEPQMTYASFPVQKEAKGMQSVVYGANNRYTVETKAEDGTVTKVRNRDFRCYNVDPTTDPDGAIARVFRIK